jgi:plasmid stabilization system protein ParE
MKHFTLPFIVFAILIYSLPVSCNEMPKEEPEQIENPLIGTWKLVSAKYRGRESDIAERYTIHKHITPTHYIWVHVDPNTEEIVMSIGGTYSFTEKTYTEQALYGFGNWYPSNRNRTSTLSCRVEDNKWHHAGRLDNGAMIEEIWERVFRVSSNEIPKGEPGQIENLLIGTWKLASAKYRGRESDIAERYTIHNHVTPTHSIWVHVNPTTQEIVRSIGGTYAFTEKTFTGKALYGYGDWYPSNRNRTNTLSCRVEDNKWYHAGRLDNGATIDEIWECVEGGE